MRVSVVYWSQGMESLLPSCIPDRKVHLLPPHCDLLVHEGCLQQEGKAVVEEAEAHLQGGLIRVRGTNL